MRSLLETKTKSPCGIKTREGIFLLSGNEKSIATASVQFLFIRTDDEIIFNDRHFLRQHFIVLLVQNRRGFIRPVRPRLRHRLLQFPAIVETLSGQFLDLRQFIGGKQTIVQIVDSVGINHDADIFGDIKQFLLLRTRQPAQPVFDGVNKFDARSIAFAFQRTELSGGKSFGDDAVIDLFRHQIGFRHINALVEHVLHKEQRKETNHRRDDGRNHPAADDASDDAPFHAACRAFAQTDADHRADDGLGRRNGNQRNNGQIMRRQKI